MGDTSGRWRISRRTGLVRGTSAIAAALSVAGCTDDVGEELPPNERWPIATYIPDLPVRQRHTMLESAIESMADEPIDDLTSFEGALADRGVEFVTAELSELLLELEYVEAGTERGRTLRVIGLITGAYTALAGAGVESDALELTIVVPGHATIGVAEVAGEWATAYNDGRLSAANLGELVTTTIETNRTPPSLDVAPDE